MGGGSTRGKNVWCQGQVKKLGEAWSIGSCPEVLRKRMNRRVHRANASTYFRTWTLLIAAAFWHQWTVTLACSLSLQAWGDCQESLGTSLQVGSMIHCCISSSVSLSLSLSLSHSPLSFHFGVFFLYFNWRLITLQYCGFCHTSTWLRHGCTCVPHPDPPHPLPSPPHPSGLS